MLIELDNTCGRRKEQRRLIGRNRGRSLFPDEEHSELWGFVLYDPPGTALVAERQIPPTILVMGCVDYLSAFGDQIHHQTRFVYEVVRNSGEPFVVPKQGEPPIMLAGTVRLVQWMQSGAYEADQHCRENGAHALACGDSEWRSSIFEWRISASTQAPALDVKGRGSAAHLTQWLRLAHRT